jgi:hypothetical protein
MRRAARIHHGFTTKDLVTADIDPVMILTGAESHLRNALALFVF